MLAFQINTVLKLNENSPYIRRLAQLQTYIQLKLTNKEKKTKNNLNAGFQMQPTNRNGEKPTSNFF